MPGASVNSISVKLRRAGTISPDVFYPAIILMCANNVLQKSLAVKVRLPSQYSDRCAPGKMPVGTDARGRIYCDFDYRILLQGNNAATTWISMVKHGQPRIVGRRRLVLLAPVLFRLAASVRPDGPTFCRLRLLFFGGSRGLCTVTWSCPHGARSRVAAESGSRASKKRRGGGFRCAGDADICAGQACDPYNGGDARR